MPVPAVWAWHTVVMFSCLDFHAVERTAHISAQSATACHRICVLCLCVWMHRDEFSYKSLVKFSACTATCITWSKSKCSDMKKRAQSTNPSQRFFYLYLPLHTPAQGHRVGKISDENTASTGQMAQIYTVEPRTFKSCMTAILISI